MHPIGTTCDTMERAPFSGARERWFDSKYTYAATWLQPQEVTLSAVTQRASSPRPSRFADDHDRKNHDVLPYYKSRLYSGRAFRFQGPRVWSQAVDAHGRVWWSVGLIFMCFEWSRFPALATAMSKLHQEDQREAVWTIQRRGWSRVVPIRSILQVSSTPRLKLQWSVLQWGRQRLGPASCS